VTTYGVLPVAVAGAVSYLLLAYAIGGPTVLIRTLIQAINRRRRRYRGMPDDVLANSRFTIPASLILPTAGHAGTADAVANLLESNYPEFEVIVVNDGTPAILHELRERFELRACEVFYRRTLSTGVVRGIFRSGRDPRLLVVECEAVTKGDALNCGVNLSRYRYVCCAEPAARYRREALLDAMRVAVEDPAEVVGVTTSLGAVATGQPLEQVETASLAATMQRLSALRGLLARNAQRRLGLFAETMPGLTLWRRDVVVEAGGFALDLPAEHLDMTFRAHRHLIRQHVPYRIVHLSEPVGTAVAEPTLGALVAHRHHRQQALARILWRHRSMLLNPQYGRLGLVNLPRYLFASVVVPWLELLCLLSLPFAVVAGVLTGGQLLLVIAAMGFGNGVLLNTAMLLAPWPSDERSLVRLIVLGPFELFIWRPVQLYLRLLGLVRIFSRPARLEA
jgi:cellulose synthase/poly-beta-1,6-N-acetylglucosamine synthase-like glycosyltransferase